MVGYSNGVHATIEPVGMSWKANLFVWGGGGVSLVLLLLLLLVEIRSLYIVLDDLE